MSQANLDINANIKVTGREQLEATKESFAEVGETASDASSGVEKASTSFSRFKNVAKAVSSEAKLVGKGIGENISNSIKSIDMPFKNLFKSLTRIAKLRLLRGIIRSITGAFKEGLGNIYQYSAALNNTDASHMKSSMDALASSLLYAKNAVGAAVAPLIASLIPTIQQVVQWFVNAASAVAQFFAALGGQTTYTKAKETATQWGAIESGASGAAAAAQEYKNTILGFDEIHALNDVPENGGGGGGGGASSPNYADMFEEAEISQKIKDIVQWLKDHFDDILEIVGAIGASMLTWKIASGIIDFFNKLEAMKAKGLFEIAAGMLIQITGLTLAFKGGYEIGYEDGFDLMAAIKSAVGIGLSGVGGALIGKGLADMGVTAMSGGTGLVFGIALGLVVTALGITFGIGENIKVDGDFSIGDALKSAVAVGLFGAGGAMAGAKLAAMGVAGAGAGVGAVFGIGIGLIIMGITITLNKTAYIIDEASSRLEKYEGEIKDILDRENTYVDVAKKAWEDYDSTVSTLGYAKYLSDQIGHLQNKQELSNNEIEAAKYYIEELNGLNLDGIHAEWDEVGQQIVFDKDQTDALIESMRQAAEEAAWMDILSAAYKDQAAAWVDLSRGNSMKSTAINDLNAALAEFGVTYDDVKDWDTDWWVNWSDDVKIANEELDQANHVITVSKGKYDDATQKIKECNDAMASLGDVASDTTSEVKGTNDAVGSFDKTNPSFRGTVQGFDGVRNSAREAEEANNDTKKAVTDFDKDNPAFRGTVKGFDGLRTAAMEADDQVKGGKENLNKLNNYAPTFGRINSAFGNVKTYANNSSGAIKNVRDEATKTGNFNPSTDIIRTALGTIGIKATDMKADVKGIQTTAEQVGKSNPSTTNIKNALDGIGSKSTTVKDKVSKIKTTAETVGKSSPSMKNLQDALWTAWYAADDDIKKIGGIKTATSDTGKYNPNMSPLQKALWTAWYAADDSIGRINDIYGAVNNLNGLSATISIGVDTVANGAKVALSSVVQDLNKIRGYQYGGFIPGFANGGYVPSFAGGGSLNSASLFIARENQAPEMVGMIGSRTAVANNPQIVEAIEGGVFRAMSQVMSNNQGTTEVNVTIDGQKVARAVDRANKVQNRRFNVQA